MLLYSLKDMLFVCTLIFLVLNLLDICNLQISAYQNILELPTCKKKITQFLIMFIICILKLTFPFMINTYITYCDCVFEFPFIMLRVNSIGKINNSIETWYNTKTTSWGVWFQASTIKCMRTVLFWIIMQWVVVISYQHFGTTYQSDLQG